MHAASTAPPWLRGLLAPAIGLLVAGAAHAHDTWLEPAAREAEGLLALALTTGSRYPRKETGLPVESVTAAACTDAAGTAIALKPRRAQAEALLLHARVPRDGPSLACWVRTREFDIRIEPPLVDVYLREIQAPAALVQQWQRQRAAGVAWQEVYAKTARIELLRADVATPSLAAMRRPTGRGLELVPVGDVAARAGAELTVRVLLDGQPLPGLAVEFLGERAPFGVWRTSDAEGLVRSILPLPGRWLLRATHLVPPAAADAPWRSRFSTLALQLR